MKRDITDIISCLVILNMSLSIKPGVEDSSWSTGIHYPGELACWTLPLLLGNLVFHVRIMMEPYRNHTHLGGRNVSRNHGRTPRVKRSRILLK